MLVRKNPDVGYIAPALFEAIGVSQTVRIGNFVHFSGIVAAGADMSPVALGDMGGQLRHILSTLRKLLEHEGMSFANLVSTTTYTTNMRELLAHLGMLKETWGDNAPTSTIMEIKALAAPEFLLELVAIAADS